MKKHAEICPVCKGSGSYKDYTDCNYTATIYVERTCHGCNGAGWVEVIDDYTQDWNHLYQGTLIFNNRGKNINKHYQEFCEEKDIQPVEFCDKGNHIPRID